MDGIVQYIWLFSAGNVDAQCGLRCSGMPDVMSSNSDLCGLLSYIQETLPIQTYLIFFIWEWPLFLEFLGSKGGLQNLIPITNVSQRSLFTILYEIKNLCESFFE